MSDLIVPARLIKPLPIYYLQPLEIVAMAIEMGEKRWAKCEQEAKRRNVSKHTKAIAYGADVRATLRPTTDMRPPEEWLREAKITPGSLKRAKKAVFDE